jgi:lipopolysaccharide export system protein LptC
LAVSFLPTPLPAQSDLAVGAVIRGFEVPKRDKDGNMQFRITGDKAIIMTPNRTEVHDLRIDIFKEGKINLTVRSPKSDYWRMENRLTSDHHVEIIWPGVTVTAKHMEWDLANSKGNLRENVRVVIDNLKPVR